MAPLGAHAPIITDFFNSIGHKRKFKLIRYPSPRLLDESAPLVAFGRD
jgi:hypothetical protein